MRLCRPGKVPICAATPNQNRVHKERFLVGSIHNICSVFSPCHPTASQESHLRSFIRASCRLLHITSAPPATSAVLMCNIVFNCDNRTMDNTAMFSERCAARCRRTRAHNVCNALRQIASTRSPIAGHSKSGAPLCGRRGPESILAR